MTVAWVVAALVLVLAEVLTTAFFAAFLAAGAVAAAIAGEAGGGLIPQILAFALVSALGILVVRPPLLRRITVRRQFRSGAGEMVGDIGVVTETIPDAVTGGHVRVRGENWPAYSEGGAAISAGQVVQVVSLRQSALVVKPAQSGGEGG